MNDDEVKRVLIDSVQNQKEVYQQMCKLFKSTVFCFTAIIIVMIVGFFYYTSTTEYEVVDEVIKEVTTSGDDADANLIEGDQYNDKATHNEEQPET